MQMLSFVLPGGAAYKRVAVVGKEGRWRGPAIVPEGCPSVGLVDWAGLGPHLEAPMTRAFKFWTF